MIKIFAVYDSKIERFMQPFYAEHVGQALRMWDQLVNDGKSSVSQYPDDFSLFEIGSFDDAKGMVNSLSIPKSIQGAFETKRKSPQVLEPPSL